MAYILDTHALIWFIEGSPLLGRHAHGVLKKPGASLVIPTIVLAEAKHLASRKRVRVPFSTILPVLESDERILFYPLDLNVLEKMPANLEIHDAIICGTALVYDKILKEESVIITKDEAIVKSGLARTLW